MQYEGNCDFSYNIKVSSEVHSLNHDGWVEVFVSEYAFLCQNSKLVSIYALVPLVLKLITFKCLYSFDVELTDSKICFDLLIMTRYNGKGQKFASK